MESQANILSLEDVEKQALLVDSEEQSSRRSPLWLKLNGHLWSLLVFFVPSYFTKSTRKTSGGAATGLLATAYLDGMRGLFSVEVFFRHFLLPWEPHLDTGFAQYGGQGTRRSFNIFKLPVLRLLYAGPAVAIFFVVSGFVLSRKPLKLIRKGDHHGLIQSLMPSVFRRSLRLFLPPLFTSFFVAIAIQLGLNQSPYDQMPAYIPRHPERLSSLPLQLKDWWGFVVDDLTQPWSWKSPASMYDTHLWTISIQFRASLIIFISLVGLGKIRKHLRGVFVFALWAYCLEQDRWEVASFFAGMFLAELHLAQEESNVNNAPPARLDYPRPDDAATVRNQRQKPMPILNKVLWRTIFALGLYLASIPRGKHAAAATPGYELMTTLSASVRTWQSLGATLMIYSTNNDLLLQRLFMHPAMRSLGKISFSLYLVHGPILHLRGWSIVPALLARTGKDTETQYQLGIVLSLLILTPVVLWVADIFQRTVERACSKAVSALESYFFV